MASSNDDPTTPLPTVTAGYTLTQMWQCDICRAVFETREVAEEHERNCEGGTAPTNDSLSSSSSSPSPPPRTSEGASEANPPASMASQPLYDNVDGESSSNEKSTQDFRQKDESLPESNRSTAQLTEAIPASRDLPGVGLDVEGKGERDETAEKYVAHNRPSVGPNDGNESSTGHGVDDNAEGQNITVAGVTVDAADRPAEADKGEVTPRDRPSDRPSDGRIGENETNIFGCDGGNTEGRNIPVAPAKALNTPNLPATGEGKPGNAEDGAASTSSLEMASQTLPLMTIFNEDSARDMFDNGRQREQQRKSSNCNGKDGDSIDAMMSGGEESPPTAPLHPQQPKPQKQQKKQKSRLILKQHPQSNQQQQRVQQRDTVEVERRSEPSLTGEQPQQPQQNQQQQPPPHQQRDEMEIEKPTDETSPSLLSEETEEWANSLVGRWWEVFWEPAASEENGSSGKAKERSRKNESDKAKDTNKGKEAAGVAAAAGKASTLGATTNRIATTGGAYDKMVNSFLLGRMNTVGASSGQQQQMQLLQQQQQQQQLLQQQQQQQLLQQNHQLVQQSTQSRIQQGLSQSQLQFQMALAANQALRHAMHQGQQHQPPQRQPAQPQRLNLRYNTPSLGLSLSLLHDSQILIKDVSPTSPNYAYIKKNDRIVGINGSLFGPIAGTDDFHAAVGRLKSTPRPMTVMLERWVVGTPMVPMALPAGHGGAGHPWHHPTATEHDLQFPPRQLEGFPPGWVSRTVKRGRSEAQNAGGEMVSSDTFCYSPEMAFKFSTVSEARRFLECLLRLALGGDGSKKKDVVGGERAAMMEFLRYKVAVGRRASNDSLRSPVMGGNNIDDIPLNVFQQQRQQNQRRQKSQQGKRQHPCDGGDIDYDEEEDDVDWYDAKIISYDSATKQFVVHFLGDKQEVTYTMALAPKVVRPSVRTWTKRSLALLSWEGDLLSEGNDAILDAFPPSTDLPEDTKRLMDLQDVGGNEDYNKKMLQYKKLLGMQQFLATRLAPHDDDDDDEEDDEEEEGGGPGPLADSTYVKHLCDCLREAEKACGWLIGQSVMLGMLHDIADESSSVAKKAGKEQTITSAARNKVSKEMILSFLLNGAKLLNCMQACDPSNKAAVAKQQRGTAKRGRRKKRRSSTSSTVSNERVFDDDAMEAAMSNDLEKILGKLLKKKTPVAQQLKSNDGVLMTSTLTHVLATLFERLWMPLTRWISTSDDMSNISGKTAAQFYSIGEVESHLQSADCMNLALIDLSAWTGKLAAKLTRARLFEMEAWSAIKACTQPVAAMGGGVAAPAETSGRTEDDCILALRRLWEEASLPSAGSSSVGMVLANHHMRNINPLGRHVVNNGLTLPSSLTRSVIEDAITVRRWVLDLNQAKAVRERTSFVQDIIERYVTLPQLPTPPFGGLEDPVATPSAMLVANTKDSITILSSNCFSYNHLIGNAAARLQSSMDAANNDAQAIFLRSKDGVASALAELMRLPVLSVVEEKLFLREELIDFNEVVTSAVKINANEKFPFSQIEALHAKLLAILDIKSDRRAKNCQQLKPNKFIDDEVRAFAVADEKVICPVTGAWVRDQYRRGSEWMANYRSTVAMLKADTPSKDDSIDVQRIADLLEEHDAQHIAVSFPKECAHLESLRHDITQWTNAVHQIALSDSLTLGERCKQLANASSLRPKGATTPTVEVINLWIRAFTWRLNLQRGIKTMTDRFALWKNHHPPNSQMVGAEYQEMLRLIRSVLAPLLIEGQDFLIADDEFASRPFLASLRSDVLRSIHTTSAQSPIRKREIIAPGVLGKAVSDHILDAKADKRLGSCLLLTRRVFWVMLFHCFFACLESNDSIGDLSDAKALLSLCPQGFDVATNFMEIKMEEMRLQKLIDDAETLESKASANLNQCTNLLQTNCYLHKEELRASLLRLSDIQSNFNSKHMELALKLLGNMDLKKRLDKKTKGLTWLVNTFSYDIFFQSSTMDRKSTSSQAAGSDRIHFNNLRGLHDTMPLTIGPQWDITGDCLDSEIVRISIMVKELWIHANQWQTSVTSVIRTLSDDAHVVKLDTLTMLTEDEILSKVIMPELELVENVSLMAHQFKENFEKLFRDEYNGTTDVNKACLPDGNSLIANNGDYILPRFSGSQMYSTLRQTLHSIKETSARLSIVTPEKATLEWMTDIFEWVESIQNAGHYNKEQLVINIDDALEILEQGHNILYSVKHEVQSYLKGEMVQLKVFPQDFNVAAMKGGTHSLGLALLRWAALLFECLKSDVNKQDKWKEHLLEITNSFTEFELCGMSGPVSSFRDATAFRYNVNSLIAEAPNLIIQDHELICSLSSLLEKMKRSDFFQSSLKAEKVAIEEKKYLMEKEKFENPQSIVDDRHELLDNLLRRLSTCSELDDILQDYVDDNSLFVGEPSVRDKSRFLLEKCLLTGMETLGYEKDDTWLDPKGTDAKDYCSIMAWNLEEAVNEKYHNSHDYRDKIRSLRFNLQDPKNPMLCARVLAGNLSLDELSSASTESLASNELKQMRWQFEEESIKNVVLSAKAGLKRPPTVISGDGAGKICIDESATVKKVQSPEIASAVVKLAEGSSQYHGKVIQSTTSLLSPPIEEYLNQSSASSSSPPAEHIVREANQILASLPPPPPLKHVKNEPVASVAPDDEFPSPPPSPLLSPTQSYPTVAKSRARHIMSNSGTDLFHITISKLKISFTTKIAEDQHCKFEVDRFLPSILVEKGRLNIDEFNKFIHEKTKSGRWNISHLKLSSIEGTSNMSSYKKFYKEYESIGRLTMIQVSDTTKIFLVTPKFHRVCKCLNNIENLSRSSTYVVVLTKDKLPQK